MQKKKPYIERGSQCCWTVLNKISEYTGNFSAVRKYDVGIWKKTKIKIFRGELFGKSGFFVFLGKFRYVTSTLYAIISHVAGIKNPY